MSADKKPVGETPEVNGASVVEHAEASLPVKPTSEFLDKAKQELETRLTLRQEYENLLKIWKNEELVELEKKQDAIIAKGLKEYFEKFKEEMKPPEPQDIQKLLNQEYETFTLKVDYLDDSDTEKSQTFTIRELPQSVEKKFYKQFKEKLLGKLQMLESFTQSGMDKPFEEKAISFLELFDEGFDMLADAAVLILNPFGRSKVNGVDIDRAWVQNNIGSDRMWRIVEAQMKVNRLRDFFSKVSTSGQGTMMTMRPNFQTLQTLVA